MYMLEVRGLAPLKLSMSPLLTIDEYGNMKCLPSSLSFTVFHSQQSTRSQFVAALQMFDPFFTITFFGGNRNYVSRISLLCFFHALCNEDADNHLTISLPARRTTAYLLFTTGARDFGSVSKLAMAPPLKKDVGQIDYGKFLFAMEAEKFREIATQLSTYNTTIWVLVSALQVKFLITSQGNLRMIAVITEGRHCIIGLARDDVTTFPITLNPIDFFLEASRLAPWVWFFRATDLCPIIQFLSGTRANILTYYPRDSSQDDLKRSRTGVSMRGP